MKNTLIHLLITITIAALSSCTTEKEYLVTIKTDYGDMHAILYDATPKHKANFIELAKDGYYDSMLFHRVMEEFMIQGGDPQSKDAKPGAPLGSGGPDYKIPAEFQDDLFHKKGALSAARQPDPVNPKKESSGSQFYIVHGKKWDEKELSIDMIKLNKALNTLLIRSDYREEREELLRLYENGEFDKYNEKIMGLADDVEEKLNIDVKRKMDAEKVEAYTTIGGSPHLDGEYTVFGQVIDGLEIIDKIATQPTDQRNRPKEDIRFFVSVEEMPKKKIEKMYNFTFPQEEE